MSYHIWQGNARAPEALKIRFVSIAECTQCDVQTISVKQLCQQSAAVEGALSPAQAPLPAAMAPSQAKTAQTAAAPGAAPLPAAQAGQAAGAAQQLPVRSHLPTTVASLPFVAGRRLQAAALSAVFGLRAASGQSWRAEALLPATGSARRLLEPQSKEAADFIYGAEAEAPAANPATAPARMKLEEAPKEGTSEGAPAPANAAAPSPAESPAGSRAPAPANVPSPLRAALVEEEPTLEHESVTVLKGAAKAPAPAEDAAVEGSTGVLLSCNSSLGISCMTIACRLY